ncbi:GNAT family N-acetyltransferase [Natronosporangium hydrolyticum]|uniref:GNAT family N-acetyltransferase n=1 Tax=Natronosporangium hydrolyticum TaxID=2811111 RepID=A0A895Y6K8_9ACTN|nr:acetate--CoA ligase [Natronosporangium hydrolyticum]QSB13374.1 GNAT family N-acetyltransferase [Natronosporangium hydrolyticum]
MTRQADVLLADGTTVQLRSVGPADESALAQLHAQLSDRSRYLRYFSPYPRIPRADLRRLVTVDHYDREALAVWAGDQLIAVGRYDRWGAGAELAEVAFTVADAYQSRGIGSVLLEHLAAAAAEAGITRFVAEVLPENGAMQRVFADAGYEVARRFEEGVVHLTFPIAPTERSREVQWAREQRAEAASIRPLLAPRGVLVYGVRRDQTGLGAVLLGNLRDAGFPGPVAVVHPAPPDGRRDWYPAAAEAVATGDPFDLAVVAVPAAAVPAAVADAAAAGVRAMVVVSAGFSETGPAGGRAEAQLLRAARGHGIRLVGPNCFGVANTDPAARLNATLAPHLPEPGRVALFSQSGGFAVALLAEADRRRVGLSSFVAAGNRADVSGNDLLQYWRDDPGTDVILLYLETFGNPRKFARLARAVGRHKPLVAVAPMVQGVAGQSAPGEAAKAALFAHSGVIRVHTVSELFDVAALLAHQPLPAGNRTAVICNSSALGSLAAAACPPAGLRLAPGYPRDLGPGADRQRLAAALDRAVADDMVDAVVVLVTPPAPPATGEPLAAAVERAAAAGEKPVVATFLAGELPPQVPAYRSVEEAVQALARVAGYAGWRREPAGVVPAVTGVDSAAAAAAAAALAAGEPAAALGHYGVDVVPRRRVRSAPEAVAAAAELGYPVALTAAGDPQWRHRSDLGAVWLDLADRAAVRRAYRQLAGRFGAEVAVQPMVAPGVACVVEVAQDPAFGPVVGFGLGGVATELLGDRAWRLAPLTDRDAAALVAAPRAAPLLGGWRGAAEVDRAALAELLVRVGRLADEQPHLRSMVLNPVLARPDGWSVLHAEVTVGEPTARPDSGPRRLNPANGRGQPA